MAKRSRTFKQFLLRVHPDRFRALPDVHAENLASVQLLNQFMDEQSGSRFHRRQTVNTPCQTMTDGPDGRSALLCRCISLRF